MPKYIFVSGGVISGIGKGISASSIAFILKSYGFKINMIKADPYLNVDAGTMNPLEHGETFVLEDGFETDMDIGSYERFVNESFSRPNSMTCGAILEKVIKDERSLAYDGKWVSLDYHVPDEIITWIRNVAKESKADITIVEIGGTVGEIGNGLFLEANKIMKIKNPNDVLHIHVSYLPVPGTLGEMKSKPVQISTQLLNSHGLHPDFLIARSESGIDDVRKEKLSRYCFVPVENIISANDVDCIYDVPINFEKENIGKNILKKLGLKPKRTTLMIDWEKKITKMKRIKRELDIGIVGKYYKSGKFDLKDSYVSVLEAINHAAWDKGFKVNIHWLVADNLCEDKKLQKDILKLDGVIVPQGWGSRGAEGKIKAIEIVRKNKIPYLGLCYGMQMAVIEYARNVLNLKDANSEEVNPLSKNQVIHLMEEQKKNLKDGKFGGTIRLGAWPCKVEKGTLLESLYSKYSNNLFSKLPTVMERHRHRYEFNNEYRERLESKGLKISGLSPDGNLVEAVELSKKTHPYFVGVQYHPELKSRFLAPHPIFMGFIDACRKKGM
ncbi:CTP synthase [candidate division WS6 bacterium RIFOXYD1_FULL_33_8]|uniref:CTP synthase (glutamine hydrolyzing) n=2 Tax=Candidatus Dojkabacteria TaxID=74243 RepID=A0A0G0DG60_9BACT|nr:MAG: CTP synthase, CTP synthase [candidate division WS6 bacterium GW2011_GWE2_33_157]KKP43578.1 MAG: CTP synthase, CTP synthase [candidate division WS6 bacterium GW2011_GWC1_33_20]KKP45596.1 MAG: CTP synthase, CTP synthase [candidate division WS6 bacterium GW2011_GWF1_33_233]KKP54352.1 MAG: CTP synthetase [candidate division WS6 bacterium GW2011_GWB1_33_6]KKP54539.1 MAG: CTP synthase, CTP synthase [candidate division WS6 bacterium GW2011_WS6_33_547]KKP56682.1 MAG: CTP synthetase [candidate 